MAKGLQVVIDCADPARLAEFWAEALGYRLEDPPPGHATWPDFLRAMNVPESEWNSASALIDPDGTGPRIFLQRVPEPKTVKNRVHLDLTVSGGRASPLEERKAAVATEVERLTKLGAERVGEAFELNVYWVVMRDPEGNEFCLH